jgi:hypothetical protein
MHAGRSYVSRFCWPTSLLFGALRLYWGSNEAKKEGKRGPQFQLVLFEPPFFREFSTRPERATMLDWVSLAIKTCEKNDLLVSDTAVTPFRPMST